MQLIENRRLRAGTYLVENVREGAKLDVASSQFSIYAFEQLQDLLKKIDRLRLLLPVRQSGSADFDLVGNEAERPLRNRLTQQVVAEKCRAWLTAHADIRNSGAVGSVGQNVFCDKNVAVQGGMDFTAEGLGFVPSSRPLLATGFTEKVAVDEIVRWFAALWHAADSSGIEQESLMKRLQAMASDKDPDALYHQILYHVFETLRGELNEDRIIKTKTGIKDHAIWKRLYKFQKDGVLGAIDKLEKYNGCIIADSVGLGKTFEALAIIKYYELRNDRVLVICPKKLRENWTIYLQNDKRNVFCEDRFRYDVLSHTDLNRTSGMSGDINLETINWGNYDLVVIDESHNFRNNPPSKKRGVSRYKRLMRDVIRAGVRTKVLMLSATPVNNRMADLKNQVAFITEGEDSALSAAGVNSIEQTLNKAQKCFNRWLDTPGHDTKSLLASMNFDYFKLLDLLTIARSRKHIQKYYGLKEVGKFPERRKPINVKEDIDTKGEFPPLKEVNRTIQRLHLAAYAPLKYVLPEKIEEYARKYDVEMDGGKFFKQIDREESLIHLMRINVLKRMESSIHSFALTTRKLLAAVNGLLEKLEHFDAETDCGDLNINDIETDSPELEDLLVGSKVKVLIRDCDVRRWRQELEDDRVQLTKLATVASSVTPERDRKLVALKEMIAAKVRSPINAENRKVIVFTAFADTAAYLYEQLSGWAKGELGVESALVTGTGANRTTFVGLRTDIHTLLTNFSPRSKERAAAADAPGEIDLLFATDCISEGQNLQDCDWLVNYDIHWNPVRIIQRFGRIDRIGSLNGSIQLVNFWPNMELDEYINLEARVSGRMVLLDISATGEENVIEFSPKMNDLEYRRKQLQQLQDSVLDLEEISGGISITDLTLNDFRMDLTEYMREHQSMLEATPFGARAAVAVAGERQGAVFCLKDMSGKKPPEDAFALAPYYLVYVADDGGIVFGPAESRETLDFLKKSCAGRCVPEQRAVDAFNVRTRKGSDMAHYQKLLGAAVESVVGRQQEEGVKSLFSRGGVRLAGAADRSVNDFEVVAFVAVVGEG